MSYEVERETYGQNRPYEKPTIVKQKGMHFPLEIIASATGETILCKQCSSCHNCR